MGRYFAAMKAVIERHGGHVEKFVGDAIMAVFGVPTLHEDDAIRATRAAVEMRDALAQFNESIAGMGIRIQTRTGLNTGEVVAGAGAAPTLVTGDAVNTAARLEQAAAAGQILVGETTARLVRHAARLEPMPAIAAKGKTEAVPVEHLLSVDSSIGRRVTETPLLGRGDELAKLLDAFDAVQASQECGVVTIIGQAGVGKSRLVAEFVGRLEHSGRAQVLRGRCLSYGDGLTYWPLREMALSAAGVSGAASREEAAAALGKITGARDDSALVADRLAVALDLRDGSVSSDEIAWAARRTVEALAAQGSLVLVIEDIHWARPAMLELLASLVTNAAAPILIVCPARPELRETNPDLAAASPKHWVIELDGLPTEAGDRLIDATAAGHDIPGGLRTRILDTAEGNPLFVEEMVRLMLESGRTSVAVPPTIEVLMAARIDQLPRPELAVAQRGAVVGRVFEEQSVKALLSAREPIDVDARLRDLLRRDVIRREPAAGPDSYKFRHILLRDAAYNAMAKLERAELHEALADWIGDSIGGREGEFDEILGHHLEQAYRYRVELRELAGAGPAIATRAARHLDRAARRSLLRGDAAASAALYGRALDLPGWPDDERSEALVRWSEALLSSGAIAEASDRAERALTLAQQLGDRRLLARARIALLRGRLTDGSIVNPSPEASAEVVIAVNDAEASGDDTALAAALYERSNLSYFSGNLDQSAAELDKAFERAIAGGDELLAIDIDAQRLPVAVVGPVPASEVAAMAQRAAERWSPGQRGSALRLLAFVESLLGRIDEARVHIDESRAIADDLRLPLEQWQVLHDQGWIEDMAGDTAAAEIALTAAADLAARLGDQTSRAFAVSRLAMILARAGRVADAMRIAPDPDSVASLTSRARFLSVRARWRAETGDARATADVEQVTEIADALAFVLVKTDILAMAGEVMAALGERAAARDYLTQALAFAERKESLVVASRIRSRLVGLEV